MSEENPEKAFSELKKTSFSEFCPVHVGFGAGFEKTRV